MMTTLDALVRVDNSCAVQRKMTGLQHASCSLLRAGSASLDLRRHRALEIKSKQTLVGRGIDDVCIEESVPADMELAAEDHDMSAVELFDDAGDVDRETGWVLLLGNTSERSQGAICLLPGDCHPPARSRLGFSRQRGESSQRLGLA